MTILIVLTIVIYHYPSIMMCDDLTIAHLYKLSFLASHENLPMKFNTHMVCAKSSSKQFH